MSRRGRWSRLQFHFSEQGPQERTCERGEHIEGTPHVSSSMLEAGRVNGQRSKVRRGNRGRRAKIKWTAVEKIAALSS